MPIRTIPNSDVTYSLIAFDARGRERKDDPAGIGGVMSARIIQDALANPPSHIFFFSHGWKGDVPAAIDQYNRWIKAMIDLPGDSAGMGPGFKPLWIGLHWPSQPWGDDELGSNSFEASSVSSNELVERYVSRLGGDPEEVRKLLQVIFHENDINAGAIELPAHVVEAYNSLAGAIGRTSVGPEAAPGDDDAPFDAAAAFDAANEAGDAFGGLSLGGLLGPLRQLSFWTMKSRARTVGEGGMHSFIAALQQALPSAKFHLMGHSFGCIVVSSILGGPGGKSPLPRTVDSAVLVQGAVSLWAYADSILGTAKKGYFNAAIKRAAVRGPLITTHSRHDTAIGVIYPVAAGLSGQVDFAAVLPRFGGIGAHGLQGLGGVNAIRMLPQTGDYGFVPGGIYNVESSEFICKRDGASGAHSDIDGPQVAHAIWQAALA
ncbi:MAG: hypothetical protein A2107_14680 [Verrucomicrobia bacterium GWF2_62_7]|nr:MAG: hypothetical protein A2107_14680 [Verrucomicrobia bacterium GWF2_62_7]